jgi:hypothetical protein
MIHPLIAGSSLIQGTIPGKPVPGGQNDAGNLEAVVLAHKDGSFDLHHYWRDQVLPPQQVGRRRGWRLSDCGAPGLAPGMCEVGPCARATPGRVVLRRSRQPSG